MEFRQLMWWSVMIPIIAGQATAQAIDPGGVARLDTMASHRTKGFVSGTERTVITAAELRRRNVQDLTELFQGRVPGIIATDYGAGSSPSFRGRGVNASGADATPRVFINDVELPQTTILRDISPDVLDSLVVQAGVAAGTFAGIGASGGVIRLYTKSGATTPWSLAAKVSGGDDVGAGVSGSAAFQDHLLEAAGTILPLRYYLAGGYTADGHWAPSYDSHVWHGMASASTTYRWANFSIFGMQHQRGFAPANNRYGSPAEVQTPLYEQNSVGTTTLGASIVATPASWLTLHVVGGRSRLVDTTAQTQPRRVNQADTVLRGYREGDMTTSTAYEAIVALPSYRGVAPTLTMGGDIVKDFTKYRFSQRTMSTGFTATSLGYLPSHRAGAFAQLGLHVGKSLALGAGLRYDNQKAFGTLQPPTQYRPRFDATYVTALRETNITVRGAYGRVAKRAGNLPLSNQNAGFIFANPALRPEELSGGELGVDIQRGSLAWGMTAFDQSGRDGALLIQIDSFYTGVGSIPITEYANAVGTRNRGATAYARGRIGPLMAVATASTVQSTYEHVDPRVGGGTRIGAHILDTPHQSAFASLSYAHSVVDLIASARYLGSHQGYSAVQPGSSIKYPGFALYDIDASYAVTSRASVITYVHNLANAERFSSNDNVYVRGRRTGVGIRLQR